MQSIPSRASCGVCIGLLMGLCLLQLLDYLGLTMSVCVLRALFVYKNKNSSVMLVCSRVFASIFLSMYGSLSLSL